jgi:hypothetical protein
MTTRRTVEELEEQLAAERERAELALVTDPGVLLAKVTEALGLRRSEVKDVVKLAATPPSYEVVTTLGSVTLSSHEVQRWTEWRRAIFDATGEVVAPLSGDRWTDVLDMVGRAERTVEVGEEATDEGLGRAWLSEYLLAKTPVDDVTEAAVTEYPFVHLDRVHIFGNALRRWLWVSRAEKVTPKRMGVVLRAAGCDDVDVRAKGWRGRAWRVPQDV